MTNRLFFTVKIVGYNTVYSNRLLGQPASINLHESVTKLCQKFIVYLVTNTIV
jgi:hypothetical protein